MSRFATYHMAGEVTALSPISHLGAQHGGTVTTLNRQKFIQPDGRVEEVPVISGNSFRGQLRDCGMRFMLEHLGMQVDLPVFHLLFSGGMLTKKGEGAAAVRTGDYRRLKELVPLLGIFGGAVGGQIMRGALEVGQFTPICEETAHLLPAEATRERNLASIYDYLQVVEFTRTDDAKQDTYRHLMAPAAVALLEGGELPLDVPEEGRESLAKAAGVATQMRYGSEVFAAGTVFWHELTLRAATELERDALFSALAAYAEKSVLGGKSAIGLGKVRFRYNEMELSASLRPTGHEVGFQVGAQYLRHLEENRAEIGEMLRRMAA